MEKVLIGTDGSRFSEKALRKACELATAPEDLCFRVITAYESVPMAAEPYALSAEYFERLDELAREQAESVSRQGVELIKSCLPNRSICVTSTVEFGRPAQVIIEEAEKWRADMIVVGSHGHGFWGRLTLGSVSDAVVHHAPCSVLVVRSGNKKP